MSLFLLLVFAMSRFLRFGGMTMVTFLFAGKIARQVWQKWENDSTGALTGMRLVSIYTRDLPLILTVLACGPLLPCSSENRTSVPISS